MAPGQDFINASLTGIYILILLPLLGIHLPFGKTMVLITALVGLLPVVGNLISNTIIVLISLSVSPLAAAASLVFLVLLHKAEYFLNARIVGGEINAKACGVLLSMVFMEALFGLGGVAIAPILYAYLKAELKVQNWSSRPQNHQASQKLHAICVTGCRQWRYYPIGLRPPSAMYLSGLIAHLRTLIADEALDFVFQPISTCTAGTCWATKP